MQYLVVGAGPAGVIAAETLRRQAPDSDITLIGDEPEPAYSRMALPYYLAGQIEEAGTHLRQDPEHFERLDINQLRARVQSIDTHAHRLGLDTGDSLGYDRLLLATGSHPVAPPIPGLDQPGVHHCWTIADARNIAARTTSGTRVALIGAGFIGCIIMEALVERGVRLEVLEMDQRMVPRMMDQAGGELIKKWCNQRGVGVHTSARVRGLQPEAGGGLRLECEGAPDLSADLVVVATGVKPNIQFLGGSGIAVGQGVQVDEHLRSSAPDVYAAGDVCEGLDWSTGSRAVHAIQPAASEHGRIAALNMAGEETAYRGSLNMNVLDTLGLISSSFGEWMDRPGGETASRIDPERFRYLRLQFEDDRLVGAIGLGLTQHVGILRGLIQSRLHLGVWKQRLLADPTRIMEAYLACTQFPQDVQTPA